MTGMPVMPFLFRPMQGTFGPGEMVAQQHQAKDDEGDAGTRHERQRQNDPDEKDDATSKHSEVSERGVDHDYLGQAVNVTRIPIFSTAWRIAD